MNIGWPRGRAGETSTPRRLLLLAGLVVLATLAVGATAVATVLSQRHTAVTLADRTSPTVVDAVRARALLADADLVAAQSLLPPGSWGPPTVQFQEDIKTAGQALARAAENSTAGEADRAQIQAVNNGLLVRYQGDVYIAANAVDDTPAAPPATGGPAAAGTGTGTGTQAATETVSLTGIYLAYASDLMREPTGILSTVAAFQARNSANLPDEGTAPWALLGGHLAAAVALLVLLARAQVFLRRRFHRAMSLGLLGAAVVLVLLAGGLTVLTLRTSHDIDRGVRETTAVACLWQAREAAAITEQDRTFDEYAPTLSRGAVLPAATDIQNDPDGQDGGAATDGCDGQAGVAAVGQADGGGPAAVYQARDARLGVLVGERTTALDDALDGAIPGAGLPWVMAAGTLALLALGAFAFWPRIREYGS
ncbi:hypothetical protein [Pseudofrankia asymbiotica]|uniref:Uncharacterized protein n=1 Tax=Pseudofrankia asymbiotica TaxID=1834516 RepID=A0A1V2I9C0_9ACTN|nr:hypothetical protein [Pseudofrankia asymbiotica]ONH29153.1 hypothetical protein BL253_17220 [Pseudofrankia asymbiotica]